MRITVVGTGYVGLVTSVCLAHAGHEVVGLDVDQAKIELLRQGRVPIYEAGVEPLLRDLLGSGRLRFEDSYAAAVPGAEAIFICVGTPALRDGSTDSSAVRACASALGRYLSPGYTVIANKSTVPIGTADTVAALLREAVRSPAAGSPEPVAVPAGGGARGDAAAVEFDVVSNPEFLREGCALRDALHPDRIILGVEPHAARAVEVLRRIYVPIMEQTFPPVFPDAEPHTAPLFVTDPASAEMIKYAANAFLATKISFINEMAGICERVGADVREVTRGIGMDRRIGAAFLGAGIGWGGSCFPKDVASLAATARDYGEECPVIEAALAINHRQRQVVIRKLQDHLKVLKGKKVALWGLAFKPGTDDIREAPALTIAERLLALEVRVAAYDPVVNEAFTARLPRVELALDPYEAARGADAVVLVTEWPEFAHIEWSRLRGLMRQPFIVDGRNFLDDEQLLLHGFQHCGIGR